MNIEGAEYDALLGSERMIDKVKPHLLLEQLTLVEDCGFNFLRTKGYVAIDSNNYAVRNTLAEFKE